MVPAEPGCWWSHPAALLYLLMSNKRLTRRWPCAWLIRQEILQLARLDPLTGLPLSDWPDGQLKHQVQSDNPGCLLFCDLNDFKRISATTSATARGCHPLPAGPTDPTPSATSAICPLGGDGDHPAAAGLRYPSGRGRRRDPPGHAHWALVVNDQPMQVGISIGVSRTSMAGAGAVAHRADGPCIVGRPRHHAGGAVG